MYLQNIFVTTKPYEKNKNSVYKNMIKIPVLFFIYLNFIYCGSNPVHVSPLTMTVNVSERTSFLSKRQEVINSVIDANENTLTAIQKILNCNSLTDGSSNKELLENLKQQLKDTISKNLERIKTTLEYFEETENGNEYKANQDLKLIKEYLSLSADTLIHGISTFSNYSEEYETVTYESLDIEEYFKKLENIKRGISNSNRFIELLIKLMKTIKDNKGMVDIENSNNLLEELIKKYGEEFITKRNVICNNLKVKANEIFESVSEIEDEFKEKVIKQKSSSVDFYLIKIRIEYLLAYIDMNSFMCTERKVEEMNEFIMYKMRRIYAELKNELKKFQTTDESLSILKNIDKIQKQIFLFYQMPRSSVNLEFREILKKFKSMPGMQCEEWIKNEILKNSLTEIEKDTLMVLLDKIDRIVLKEFESWLQIFYGFFKHKNRFLKESEAMIYF